MVIGMGIDIIEIDRIKKAIERSNKFLDRCFSEEEKIFFDTRNRRGEVIAGNFAAKEAFAKAMGTGIREFELAEISVLRDALGKPYIKLSGSAREIVNIMAVSTIHVSISHCRQYAVANVILESVK